MSVRCETCREQMLDFLYGLLDPSEEAALAAHLAECPTCSQAKADASDMQALFAAAAKAPFPDVQFTIPIETEIAPTARPHPAKQFPRSTRWAVAAGLLIAALGMLSPAIREYASYRKRAASAALAQQKLTDIERSDAARSLAHSDLIARLDRELRDARESHRERIKTWVSAEVSAQSGPFRLEVAGPVSAIPGAPNEYAIVARSGDRTVPVTVTAVVRDSRGREYFRSVLPPDSTKLILPASLWAQFPAGVDDLVLTVSAVNDAGARAELAEPIQLLAPVFTTLVVTDKPLYRPGERVFFRSLTLNRTNLQPPAIDLTIRFELRKPDGTALEGATTTGTTQPVFQRDGIATPIVGPDGKPVRGIACGVLGLPETLPGGEYTLAAYELPAGWVRQELPKGSTPIGTRKIIVAKYQPEVLTKTLEFDAKTYGPGDTVRAKITVKNQGKPLANIGLLVSATHGKNSKIPVKFPFQLQRDGTADVSLVLPNVPELQAPMLTVTILDQNNETLVRRIPLATQSLNIEFFPEGGDLIEGLPNRVYLRATTATGQPADITGVITDGSRTICEVKTLTDAERPGVNQGLGLFAFTPEAGKRYALQLLRPVGTRMPAIKLPELAALGTGYILPKAEVDGVVLAIPNGVLAANDPIVGTLTSAKSKRNIVVGVYTRGFVVGHARVTLEPGQSKEFRIAPPPVPIGGVTRVTVFEEPPAEAPPAAAVRGDLIPVAERLIFRRPTEQLHIAYSADKESYAPGDKVTLNVTASDEKNRPTAAVLMAAVVNQSVVAMADDKTERQLPTHFLLAGELQHPEQLEHADFVLTNHPKAAETLDLLLGTQGWRRFAEAHGEFKSSAISDAEKQRFWIANGRKDSMTESVRPDRLTARELHATDNIDSKIDQLESARKAAEKERDRQSPELQIARSTLESERNSADASWSRTRYCLLAGLVGVVLLFGFAWVAFFTARSGRRTVLLALIALVGVLLSVGLVFNGWLAKISPVDSQSGVAAANNRILEEAPQSDIDLRETPTIQAAARSNPQSMFPEALPRSDIGPPPPVQKTSRSPTVKLNTDRADRAVRAIADGREDVLRGEEMAAMDRIKKSLVRHAPFVVREYAHIPSRTADDTRSDFTETVLWQPLIVLPGEGQIDLSFHLSDSTNAYRVLVAGHTLDGRLGSATGLLEVRKPLEIEARLPPELSTADQPMIPLVLANSTSQPIQARSNYWSDFLVSDLENAEALVPAGGGARQLVPVKPIGTGPARVRVSTAGGPHSDASERSVSIVPDGFPFAQSTNLELRGSAKTTITIPQNLVPKSLSLRIQVFTNSMADIQSGLDGILREPHGCFEQTSSANYPNVLAMDYLKDVNRLDSGSADQTRGLLERGLSRLTSFEVATPHGERAGFEWFGAYPAHECLTAYGLMQFTDMAAQLPVDPKLLDRTKQFLIARRDGRGGFLRKRDAHAFGAVPDAVANAYILWAIRMADRSIELSLETKAVAEEALRSNDPYRLALATLISPTPELLKALADHQTPDGSLPGAETSITRSRNKDLVVETTALAALAFQGAQSPTYNSHHARAIGFLLKSREPHGSFGGTQATILALKAIVAHNKAQRRPMETGEIIVRIDGRDVERLKFQNDELRPVQLDFEDAEKRFPPGPHEITIETTAKQTYPVTVAWSAYSTQPSPSPNATLDLNVKLNEDQVIEGGTTRLNIQLRNREDNETGMAVAVIGLPAGLKLPADHGQLKASTARSVEQLPTIDHWEIRGRELVLYWRGLKPQQTVDLALDLIAELPGTFRGPASRAYLYYDSEAKNWVAPLGIKILPRR